LFGLALLHVLFLNHLNPLILLLILIGNPLCNEQVLHPLTLIPLTFRLLPLQRGLPLVIRAIGHIVLARVCCISAFRFARVVFEDCFDLFPEDRWHVFVFLLDYWNAGDVVRLFCVAAARGVWVGYGVGAFLQDSVQVVFGVLHL
jgi:hypothetical protein